MATEPDPPDSLVEWVTTLWSYSDAKDVAWFHARGQVTIICPHAVSYGNVDISVPQHVTLSKLSWQGKELRLGRYEACRAIYWQLE
jgi:hypothetical protein